MIDGKMIMGGVIGVIVLIGVVVCVLYSMSAFEEHLEPQVEGGKESYENTKLWTVAFVIIVIVLLVIAILYLWGIL